MSCERCLIMMRALATKGSGFLAMFLTLFIFWLLVSGESDVQHLVAGGLSALLVSWYWRSLLRRVRDRDDILPHQLVFCPLSLGYLFTLLWRILKSNLNVARIVLDPRLPISPVVTRTQTCLKHDLIKVLFAHSITLTPGTLTMSLSGSSLVVHSLTEEAADADELAQIQERLREIERRLG